MKEQKLTWRDIEKLTHKIGDEISDDGLVFDYIVAVGRGGYIPGVILSHYLKLPLLTVLHQTRDTTTKSYQDTRWDVEEDINNGKTVLLLDDINDSGKTFLDLLNEWNYNEESRGELITAALLQRYNTASPASLIGRKIRDDRWIVFPWENVNEN